LPKESSASRPNPSTRNGRETIHDGLSGSHIAEQLQQELNDEGVDLSKVAYVSGFIAKHVLHVVRCDDCTSSVMLSTIDVLSNRTGGVALLIVIAWIINFGS